MDITLISDWDDRPLIEFRARISILGPERDEELTARLTPEYIESGIKKLAVDYMVNGIWLTLADYMKVKQQGEVTVPWLIMMDKDGQSIENPACQPTLHLLVSESSEEEWETEEDWEEIITKRIGILSGWRLTREHGEIQWYWELMGTIGTYG